MKDKLYKIYKWKSITPNRTEFLLEVYKEVIGGEIYEEYKICKCPDALRIMFIDLKKHYIEKYIK